jgi:hypothetical protein
MTLNEIKAKYTVSKSRDNKNQYLLSGLDNDYGKYLPNKFYCTVEMVDKSKFKIIPSIHFTGDLNHSIFNPTKSIDTLNDNIAIYVSRLEFNSDIYYPNYRKNCFYQYASSEYLESIGFKYDSYGNGNAYILENEDVFGKKNNIELMIDGIDIFDESNNVVEVKMLTGKYSYVSIETKMDINEIIGGINNLIRPLCLGNSIKQFELFNKLNKSNINYTNITKTTFNENSLSVEHVNYKEKLINELEEMLKELKK